MKLNGKNIIFDDDITMTGKNLGEKLSDVVGELQSKSSKMESYLKWIYNYGGVGGSGGGGGGGSDSGYILFAKLEDLQLINKQNISLGKPGIYNLMISVQRPNGATFSASYKIIDDKTGETLLHTRDIKLNVDNNYTYNIGLDLQTNVTLIVEITDSVFNITKQVSSRIITRSFDIKMTFVDNNGVELGDEITVTDAKANGLNMKLSYKVSVNYKEIYYSLSFNLGKSIIKVDRTNNSSYYKPIDPSEREGEIVLNLLDIAKNIEKWEPKPENSGYYSIEMITNILIDGQETSPIEKEVKFNLIPPSLYLLVSPATGNIYTSKVTGSEKPYEYGIGYVGFNLKPYLGTEQDTSCTIYYYINEDKENIKTIYSNIRKQEPIKVYITNEGLNTIHFNLNCGGISYPGEHQWITYYFYIKKDEGDLTWYKIKREGTYNYYRGGHDDVSSNIGGGEWRNKNLKKFRKFVDGLSYRQSVNKPLICINYNPIEKVIIEDKEELDIPGAASAKFNTTIHLGLQYSEINSEDAVIFTGYVYGSSNKTEEKIKVYQDRIIVDGKTIKYYFPKTKDSFGKDDSYHLLSIINRYIYSSDALTSYYETTVYIDGKLEGASELYINSDLRIAGATIGSTNLMINLVDISFPTSKYKGSTESDKVSDPEDLDVYQYYLKYISPMYTSDGASENDKTKFKNYKEILNISRSIDVHNNGEVTCTKETVANIAHNLNIPTLKLTIQDNDGKVKTEIDQSYEEEQGGNEYKTIVSWSKAFGDLDVVGPPADYKWSNYGFYIKIQGSSTKSYKCKNFTLSLKNEIEDSEVRYLFSPNFNEGDTSSFLPESQFTLKADVVDSSHSNNTSIGRFVNDVSTKFNTGNVKNKHLHKYIKNCLDGFPIAVFIEYAKKTENQDTTSVCYYQGVYNFNLGRESQFNLGYSDYSVFCDSDGISRLKTPEKGFLFTSINNSESKLKSGLVVAEIQGNSAYFDFSQFDESILFNKQIGDKLYMFGDLVTGSGLSEDQAKKLLTKLVEKVSMAGGYIFGDQLLNKTFSNSESDHYGYDEGYHALRDVIMRDENGDPIIGEDEKPITKKLPANQVPNYRKQFIKEIDSGGNTTFKLKDIQINDANNVSYLENLIIKNDNYSIDDVRRNPWVDFQSLSEYYTICMAFGLIDSVQKNMNLKAWNANIDREDPTKDRATFYAAFYDMDTSLGVNNAGNDVSYFAFSDYWDYAEDSLGGDTIQPSDVTIYRDYSPKTGNETGNAAGDFYDTASSYLFAVAKYARKVFNETKKIDGIKIDVCTRPEVSDWPKELWAKWRQLSPKEMGGENSEENKTLGCLSSAEKFMNKYFANTLGNISPIMVSMNYRNKYLVQLSKEEEKTKFNKLNFQKFNGTRIYKATDWLSSRFHILDAYFNLPNTISTYQYYNKEGIYDKVQINNVDIQEPFIENSDILSKNPDVFIYQDIFAANSKNQGAGTLNINIKSKQYSPLFISTANTAQRFLLGGNKHYNIITKLDGTQTYKFGGSGSWTELDSINTFNLETLTINSKYLETLNSNNNNSMNVSSDTIIMPSLKDLILTGPNFKGSLKLNGIKYPNLNRVNISNTAISLNLDKSSCKEVNIANLKRVDVVITNCSEIEKINFGKGDDINPSTRLTKCEINPIPKKLAENGIIIDHANIETLSFSNASSLGKSSISIKNDNTINNITLEGFSSITVENCPKLQKLLIVEPKTNEGDNLKVLYINNCGEQSNEFKIGILDTAPNTADLEIYENLSRVTIRNCIKLTRIKLPKSNPNNIIELPTSAFEGDTNLMYLSGVGLKITGPRVFKDDYSFKLQQGPEYTTASNKYIKFSIGTTDVSSTFRIGLSGRHGSIDRSAAQSFLLNSPDLNQVTNISYIFYNQNISYSDSDLRSDLKAGSRATRTLNFKPLTKVTNASSALSWNNISAVHPWMLAMGSDVLSINADSIVYRGYLPGVTTTLHILKDILPKLSGSLGIYSTITFVDDNGNTLGTSSNNPVKLKEFFHPNGIHPENITSIDHLGVNNKFVDLEGVFDNWPSLYEIRDLFYDKEYNYGNNPKLIGLEGLLKYKRDPQSNKLLEEKLDLPNLRKIYESFNIRNENDPIDLWEFVDWKTLLTNASGAEPLPEWTYNRENGSFRIRKFITRQDFDNLWVIIRGCKCTSLTNLFRNCTLITSENQLYIGDGGISNTTIKNISGLFFNFKIKIATNLDYNTDKKYSKNVAITGDSKYFYINPSFFKVLSNVTKCQYLFEYTMLTSRDEKTPAIPLNFFNRRIVTEYPVYYISPSDLETLTEDPKGGYVYKIGKSDIKPGVEDKFKASTLYLYTYKDTIVDMQGMFKNVKWEQSDKINARSFIFNKGDDYLPSDYIKIIGTEEIHTTDGLKYFIKSDRSVTITNEDNSVEESREYYFQLNGILRENTEISDIKEIVESKSPLGDYSKTIISDNQQKFTNFNLGTEATSRLFIAPDFFYACNKANCNIQEVFSNDEDYEECLEGLIPNNLLKNCKSYSFANMMKNLNIVPRFFRVDELSSIDVRHVYSYIPSNFTEYTDLGYSFNFHLILPDRSTVTGTPDGDKHEYNTYYILLDDSIGTNTLLIPNSFPSNGRREENLGLIVNTPGVGWPNSHFHDYDIHYNLMYNKESKKEGLDLSKFNKLRLDNLIPSQLAFFLYGNLFNEGFKLDNIKWNNSNNYIIKTNNNYKADSPYWILSKNCILPAAASVNSNFRGRHIIQYGSGSIMELCRSQIEDPDEPYKTIHAENPSNCIRLID